MMIYLLICPYYDATNAIELVLSRLSRPDLSIFKNKKG